MFTSGSLSPFLQTRGNRIRPISGLVLLKGSSFGVGLWARLDGNGVDVFVLLLQSGVGEPGVIDIRLVQKSRRHTYGDYSSHAMCSTATTEGSDTDLVKTVLAVQGQPAGPALVMGDVSSNRDQSGKSSVAPKAKITWGFDYYSVR